MRTYHQAGMEAAQAIMKASECIKKAQNFPLTQGFLDGIGVVITEGILYHLRSQRIYILKEWNEPKRCYIFTDIKETDNGFTFFCKGRAFKMEAFGPSRQRRVKKECSHLLK